MLLLSEIPNLLKKNYSLISRGKIDEVDRETRRAAKALYEEYVKKLDERSLMRIIDRVTGGLGYYKGDFNIMRMGYVGSLIAWPEAVKDNAVILEIGTGLGRTCYVLVEWTKARVILSVDISLTMLSIALYRNPVRDYQNALWDRRVKVCFGDACEVVKVVPFKFNHIVHDGGPNPGKNPELYSYEFLSSLRRLLAENGTLSIFAGRNPEWQNRLYYRLRKLGFKVEAVKFPYSRAIVFHCSLS